MKVIFSKKGFEKLLLIVFYAIFIYNPNGFISMPGYISKIAFFTISCYSLCKIYSTNNVFEKSFFYNNVFKFLILPDIIIFLYSIIVCLFQDTQYSVMESTISLFADRVLIVLFIWSNILKFGYRAIDYFFLGGVISYTYTLINYFIEYGIVTGLSQATIGSYGLSIEVHNMTYIFGYLFLYYLLIAPKNNKFRMIKAVLCLVFIYFGQKRLIFLALAIALTIWVLIYKLNKKYIIRVGCILLLLASLIYLWLIHSGIFQNIILALGIETSSRLRFYMYFHNDFSLSPMFLGRGITYTDEVMASAQGINDLNLPQATTVHNDILRLFIGIGTIPYIAYIYNILYVRVKKIQKYYSDKVASLYFILSIVYFVNWFASNAGLEMWCYSGYVFCMLAMLYFNYRGGYADNEKIIS